MPELQLLFKKKKTTHTTDIFLSFHFLFVSNIADDFSSQENLESPEAGGWDALLSSEDEDDFFDLQIVKHYDGEVRH